MPPKRPGSVRHDLLANVHTLGGALELLQTTKLTARQRRYLEVCNRAVGAITALCAHVAAEPPAEPARLSVAEELAALAVSYLPKPVTRGALLEKLRSLAHGRHPRVLVADDSPDSCMLVEQYLRGSAGVDVVHDGRSALEKRATEAYDFLLIDLDMPVMDGCSAIREIRGWESTNHATQVPIIVMTAHDLRSPIEASDAVDDTKSDVILVEPDPEIAHLVPGFLASRRHDVQTILEALTDSDYELIRTLGHQLKGAGGGFGFDGISVIGHRLEEGAGGQDVVQIHQAVTDLTDYLDRVNVADVPASLD